MPVDTMTRPIRERAAAIEWIAEIRLGYLLSVGVVSANFLTIVILGLQQTLHFSPASSGFIGSCNLAGIAIGSLVVALFAGSLAKARCVVLGFIAAGMIDLASPAITQLWPTAAMRFVEGAAGGATLAALGVALARHKSPARVVGATLVIQLAQSALALMVLPPLIGRWGMAATYFPMAVVALVGLALLPFESKTLNEMGVSSSPRLNGDQSRSGTRMHLLVGLAAAGLFVFQGSRFMTASYGFAIGDYFHLDRPFVASALGLSTFLGILGSLIAFVVGSRLGQTWPIIAGSVIMAAMNAAFVTWGGNRLVFILTSDVSCIAAFALLPYFLTVCVAIDASGRLAVWTSFISTAGLAAGPVAGGWLLSNFGMLPLLIIASTFVALSGIASAFPALAIDRKTSIKPRLGEMMPLASADGTAPANRQFKADPRLLVSAKGMYYYSIDGWPVLDATSGLWCVNAGHGRQTITAAVERQLATLDYAPSFQLGHPIAFEFAERLARIAPERLDRVFFTGSGSESVDTALKIALAYQRAIGQGSRTRLIGRERGYHGVGFGGISVGGLVNNRRAFAPLLPGVDHLRHTHDLERNAFVIGQPDHGAELADDLERLVALHGAETIAAVIVEPVAGSTGVLIPPKGYLERLRSLCSQYGILLIFDEVITGFGRLGAPFAADYFGVTPDLMTTAKGLTNGTIPMGAVFASRSVHDALMSGPADSIELFHGYTYSGHPVACAAGLAALDIYEKEGLLARREPLEKLWQEVMHALRGSPHVVDVRTIGLVAGIELTPRDGAPGARAYDVFTDCFKRGTLIRVTGDIIALSPPLIVKPEHIQEIASTLEEALRRVV
jgi:beta-alanine--pyruvate transaminase